ncbi:hypothetical protein BS47DRAFT_1392068 [Hydnum rufescens UP504]|uniref:Uncharacterized protein n=1 Tax=Hydnum rufescens UP504 TaxID=1448309 RepID=A0A9P6DV07_9AGAM|nr:hypothetical protein BS47DRAFT_1392068 [Hydnum rufescens UP504]
MPGSPLEASAESGRNSTLLNPFLLPIDSTLSNDDYRVRSQSNNALLHWFPLADKAVEPIPTPHTPSTLPSPLYTHESLSTMGRRLKSLKLNLHMRIAHHVPSSDHEDVLYHPAMHESRYLEIVKRLDEPVGDYTDPFSSTPVTTFQFISIWMKFTPAQYHTSYFLFEEDQQEWYVDRELLIMIQTALERLQNVITNVVAIVGEEPHTFVIDRDSKLTEQLWTSKELKKLMMADKLLKLRAELTLVRLYKLRKLHQGESLSTPMASEDSLPPIPELREQLHKAWHDPHLPTKKIARRAVAAGWEALEADVDGLANPPSELAAFSRSSNYRASSIDLELSPSKWQEVPLQGSSTPTPNPRNRFVTFSQRVSTLGEGLRNALWTPSKANLGVGRDYSGLPPSGGAHMHCVGEAPRTRSPLANYLINQAESAEGGARQARSLWNAATDTPALPAPGVSRAHGYYAEMLSALPTRPPATLFPQEQATAPIPFTFPPMKGLLISQASNGSTALSGPLYAGTSEPIPMESKGKGPMPPPSCPTSSKGSEPGPSRGGGGGGDGGGSGSPGRGGTANVLPQGITWDHHLKWTVVPKWDGDKDTAIDWLYECNDLVNLGPELERMMPTIVSLRFKGAVATAWQAHSTPVKHTILQSWDNLCEWVLHRYLGEAWYTSERLKYNSEVF